MKHYSLTDLNLTQLDTIDLGSALAPLQHITPNSPYPGFYITLLAQRVIVTTELIVTAYLVNNSDNLDYTINLVSAPGSAATIEPTAVTIPSNVKTDISLPLTGNGYGVLLGYIEQATSNTIVYQNIIRGFI